MIEQKEKYITDAYEVLGLDIGASKEEIEKRYALLIKKYRAMALSEDEECKAEGEKYLKSISEAYNSIIESELKAIRASMQGPPNPVLQKMGVNEEKAKNIIHYYKFHFIFALLGIIILSSTIYGFVTKVKPDFNMTVMGDFYLQETESLKQALKKNISVIKEPTIEVITIGGDIGSQQEYAMQMKAITVIAAGVVDVFVLDRANFDKYAAGGAFISLDNLVRDLKIDKNKCYAAKTERLQEEAIFGLEVGSSELFQNIMGENNEKILAITTRPENYDKAVKLVEYLFK